MLHKASSDTITVGKQSCGHYYYLRIEVQDPHIVGTDNMEGESH